MMIYLQQTIPYYSLYCWKHTSTAGPTGSAETQERKSESLKMRRLYQLLNLFICFISSQFNAVTSIIYAEIGRTLTLNVTIQGNPEEILWKHNGNKLAERDLTGFQDYGQFKGRSGINITSGQLSVRNVTHHDSGAYESEVQTSGKLQTSKHTVRVIDAVQEPSVSCKVNKTTESTTLQCSVADPQSVTYRWTGAISDPDQHLGPQLQISTDQQPDSVYTCTVSNPVSRKNTSVTLRACGTETSALQTILIMILVSTAVIVLIAVIICILQRRTGFRSRARRRPKRRTQKTTNTQHVDREEQAFANSKKKEKQCINTHDDDDDDDDDEGSNEHRTNHDKAEPLSPATDTQERKTDTEERTEEPENTDADDTNETHLADTSETTEGATEAGDAEDVDNNADDGD